MSFRVYDGNDELLTLIPSEYNDADKSTEYSIDDDGDGTIDHRTVMSMISIIGW